MTFLYIQSKTSIEAVTNPWRSRRSTPPQHLPCSQNFCAPIVLIESFSELVNLDKIQYAKRLFDYREPEGVERRYLLSFWHFPALRKVAPLTTLSKCEFVYGSQRLPQLSLQHCRGIVPNFK